MEDARRFARHIGKESPMLVEIVASHEREDGLIEAFNLKIVEIANAQSEIPCATIGARVHFDIPQQIEWFRNKSRIVAIGPEGRLTIEFSAKSCRNTEIVHSISERECGIEFVRIITRKIAVEKAIFEREPSHFQREIDNGASIESILIGGVCQHASRQIEISVYREIAIDRQCAVVPPSVVVAIFCRCAQRNGLSLGISLGKKRERQRSCNRQKNLAKIHRKSLFCEPRLGILNVGVFVEHQVKFSFVVVFGVDKNLAQLLLGGNLVALFHIEFGQV